MCNCGCQKAGAEPVYPAPEAENKSYTCYQCNTFKQVAATEPSPECCGKKMQEMD